MTSNSYCMHELLARLFHYYSKLSQTMIYKPITYIDLTGPNVIDGDVAIYRPNPGYIKLGLK